jgi:transposase-like protein
MSTVTSELHLAIAATPVLDQLLREGARRMLQHAIEREVAEYVDAHAHETDERGRRLVVRNGHLPARQLQTPVGPLRVEQPRVDDRRTDADGNRAGFRFTSSILPKYLRKSKSIEELVPWLYLKGISSSDFPEALSALGLRDGSGLSASSVIRMKELWRGEWLDWSRRSLAGKRYVYVWADGIYFNVRLEEPGAKRACVLVLMGATEDGTKELVALSEGHRESEMSWRELLADLKSRGLESGPELAVGDGALGFWKALSQVFPSARPQRCWVHKTANVLNALPQNRQESAKHQLQQIWMAATRAQAHAAFDAFIEAYQQKYPKAAACLAKDRDELLAFYDFPAEHWSHLRTTNPIESTFATVRLRTQKTKGSGTRAACLTMTFKLVQCAQRRWHRLKGSSLMREVMDGIKFIDGIRHAA